MDAKTQAAFIKLLPRLTPEVRAEVDAALARKDDHGAFRLALLGNLSDWQMAAVNDMKNLGGHDITEIIAAAGSGKTTLSVASVADIIATGVLRPVDLYMTTFTQKAASELRVRLSRVLPSSLLAGLRVGTFHSLSRKYMERRANQPAHRWGMNKNVEKGQASPGDIAFFLGRITGKPWKLDKRDLPAHLRNVPPWELRDSEKYREVPGLQGFYGLTDPEDDKEPVSGKDYAGALELITAQGLALTDPEGRKLAKRCEDYGAPLTDEEVKKLTAGSDEVTGLPNFVRAWELYEQAKKNLGLWDYADLLRAYWKDGSDKAALVLIDEAQDNSLVQLHIAQMLAKNGDGRLYLIGDCRQGIYQWRGADPRFMAEAPQKLGAKVLQLPVNYRSGQEIVDIGNEIAQGKWWSIGMDAISFRGERGFKGEVTVLPHFNGLMAEANAIAKDIRAQLDAGIQPPQIAVLVRTNAPGANFEIACLRNNVPAFRLGSKHGFFDRRVVKIALAYARLSQKDDMESLKLATSYPKRFLGGETVVRALERLGAKNITSGLAEILATGGRLPGDGKKPTFYPKQMEGIRSLRNAIALLREAPWRKVNEDGQPAPSETDMPGRLMTIMQPPKVEDAEGDPTEDTDVELVAYFCDILRGFAGLDEIEQLIQRLGNEVKGMEFIELSEDEFQALPDHRKQDYLKKKQEFEELASSKVTILTCHKSKGLEFKRVYLSVTGGIFPHYRSTTGARRDEEERLFYVATTRAEDQLVLSYATMNPSGMPAGASPFLTTYVLPVLNKHLMLVEGASWIKPLQDAGWTLTLGKITGIMTLTSPDARVALRATFEGVPFHRVGSVQVRNPRGQRVSVTIALREKPEAEQVPSVTFEAFVAARAEDEDRHRDHPVEVPQAPGEVVAAVTDLLTEAQTVYGSVLEALPSKPLVAGQPAVADVDGRWQSIDVAGYGGPPLYRVLARDPGKASSFAVPQHRVKVGDGVDIEWEEFLAFLRAVPVIGTTSGSSLAEALAAARDVVLPIFREVMSTPDEIAEDAPIPEVIPVAPEPEPPSAVAPPHTEVVELRPGDWRVYRGGRAVFLDGSASFPTREVADQAAATGTTARPRRNAGIAMEVEAPEEPAVVPEPLGLRATFEAAKRQFGYPLNVDVGFKDAGGGLLFQGNPVKDGDSYRVPFHWSGEGMPELDLLMAAPGVTSGTPRVTEVWRWTGPSPGTWVLAEGDEPPEEPEPPAGMTIVDQEPPSESTEPEPQEPAGPPLSSPTETIVFNPRPVHRTRDTMEWVLPGKGVLGLTVHRTYDGVRIDLGGIESKSFPTYLEARVHLQHQYGIEAPRPVAVPGRRASDEIGRWDLGSLRFAVLKSGRKARVSFNDSTGLGFIEEPSVEVAIRELEKTFGTLPKDGDVAEPEGKPPEGKPTTVRRRTRA